MKSWYSRITDTVKRNDYTVYELRDFLTRESAQKIVEGTREIVGAAKRRAQADVDTRDMDLLELKAAEMAARQMEEFCAVLPFVEVF